MLELIRPKQNVTENVAIESILENLCSRII